MAKRVKIPGRLESAETGNIVTGADAVMDDEKGKTQVVINSEVDAAIINLAQGKQDNLTFDSAPTEDSPNPVTSAGVYTADKVLSDAIEAILLLIPSAASALNKLVDMQTMNSSIATATASFKGTYNLVSDLHLGVDATHEQIGAALDALSLGADNNDYAFVQVPNSATAPTEISKTERYKFNGTNWLFEYDLNNSGFTQGQWNAINSGVTSLLVGKLSNLPTDAELTALLAEKQDNLTFDNVPTAGSPNPVKSGGVYARNNEIVALINALDAAKQDVLTFDNAPVEGSPNPVKSGGVYTAISAVQAAIVALDAAKQNVLTFDSTPMLGSQNPVTSSGIKNELNRIDGNITTLNDLYEALTQSALVIVQPTDTWPVASPATKTIYRVVDRVNTPPQYYSDYMWNGSTMVLMATYNNAIDDVPTPGSNNLVKSGGVYNGLNTPFVSSGTLTFGNDINLNESLKPLNYKGFKYEGLVFDTLPNGSIHVYGTVGTNDIFGYTISNEISLYQKTVFVKIQSLIDVQSVNANFGLWNGSTAFMHVNLPTTKTTVFDTYYVNSQDPLKIYCYAEHGTQMDVILTFGSINYKGFYMAPNSKTINETKLDKNGNICFTGGDENFLIETNINLFEFNSYPYCYFPGGLSTYIDFDQRIIDTSGNHGFLITKRGWKNLPAINDLNYGDDDEYIQFVLYDHISNNYSVVSNGQNLDDTKFVLFGIYKKRIVSPYNNSCFIGGELIRATMNIDTVNQTYTFDGIILIGDNWVKIENFSGNFTYLRDYIHFVYYDGTNIKIREGHIYNTSGVSIAFKENEIPLFYFYKGKTYGYLATEVKIYIDGIIANNDNLSFDNDLKVKKIAFLGDSITEGVGAGGNNYAYPKWIQDKLSCTVLNFGLSGSAITVTGGQHVQGYIERVTTIPSDCNIVAFMGGTNDYWQNVPLGTYGDTTSSTFYGALDVLINALQDRFPTALIYAVVPPMGYNPDNNFDGGPKSNIGSFEDVGEAIIKMARKYSLPVLDLMHECGLNPKNNTIKQIYYSDGVHLTAAGEKILADMHIGFLRKQNRLNWD